MDITWNTDINGEKTVGHLGEIYYNDLYMYTTTYPNLPSTTYKSKQWTDVKISLPKYTKYAIIGYSIANTSPGNYLPQFMINMSKSYKDDSSLYCFVYNYYNSNLTATIQLAINLIYIP